MRWIRLDGRVGYVGNMFRPSEPSPEPLDGTEPHRSLRLSPGHGMGEAFAEVWFEDRVLPEQVPLSRLMKAEDTTPPQRSRE